MARRPTRRRWTQTHAYAAPTYARASGTRAYPPSTPARRSSARTCPPAGPPSSGPLSRPPADGPRDTSPPPPPRRADPPATAVSSAFVRAFLSSKDGQRTLERLVRICAAGMQRADKRDILQTVCTKMVSTTSPARSEAAFPSWLFTTVSNTAKDFARRKGVHLKWLDAERDVQELPPAPEDARDDDADAAPTATNLVGPTIEKLGEGSPRDAETLEILRLKARSGMSWEKVAEERAQGESVTALRNRVHKFKKKYAPLVRKHEEQQRAFLLWLKVGAAAVVAGAVALLIWWLLPPRVRLHEDPSVAPPTLPVPTASASAEPFDQALPPSPPPAPPGTEKPGGGH